MSNRTVTLLKRIVSVILCGVILAFPLSLQFGAAAQANDEGKLICFEDNFNRASGKINGNKGWYSYNEVKNPPASHEIKNGALNVCDFSKGDGTGANFTSRPASEAALNQRVSVDILNLGSFASTSFASVHVRFMHPATYTYSPDYSYFAEITSQYISIGKIINAWREDKKQKLDEGGEKTYYNFNPEHLYRIELIAEGSNPTTLTATLYDVTVGSVPVASVQGSDSFGALQSAGRVALSFTSWQNNGEAAIYDNFKYEYPDAVLSQDKYFTLCHDDFDRQDGNVGNDWVKGDMCLDSISDGVLSIATTNRPYIDEGLSRLSESAIVRPQSEAELNQTVSAVFKSSECRPNIGGALIARCQGETAQDDNCYRLYAQFGWDYGGTEARTVPIVLCNSKGVIFNSYSNLGWGPYLASNTKYRLTMSATSISPTQTKIVMKMHLVNDDGSEIEQFNDSYIDDDPVLQNKGTAGFSIFNNYSEKINVYSFDYGCTKAFSFYDDKTEAFDFFEAESDETFMRNFAKSGKLDDASDGYVVSSAKAGASVSFDELKNTLKTNSGFVAYKLNAPVSGNYKLRLRYRLGCESDTAFNGFENPYVLMSVNGKKAYKVTNGAANGQFGTSDDIKVTLNAGVNFIYCLAPSTEILGALSGAYIDYDCLFATGNITVATEKPLLPGDVTADKQVDILDLVRLKKYFVDNSVEIDDVAADMNADREEAFVDSLDLALIKKLIVSGDDDNVDINAFTWLKPKNIIDYTKVDLFKNTYYKLEQEKKLRVGYFGGSITYGTGSTNAETSSWRALTTAWLKSKYPDAQIEETNAAIGGTGTAYGIYRMVDDLKLETDKPDLVFLEFAINDIYDGTPTATAKANVEYIIRTIYKYAPDADIFMILTTDQACMNNDFDMLVAHRSVAEAYNIPYLCVGKMLWTEMLAENNGQYPTAELYSKYYSDTVHPANAGHAKYASYIKNFLNDSFVAKLEMPQSTVNSYMPDEPINDLPVNPHTVNLKGENAPANIGISPEGYITSNVNGANFSFVFIGTDIKLWQWGTPANGSISVSIDGNAPTTVDLYYESYNHIIKPIASGLADTLHTVDVTLNGTNHGTQMDLRYFLVSGSTKNSGGTETESDVDEDNNIVVTDDFNRNDGGINGNNNWYSVIGAANNAEHNIKNNHLELKDYTGTNGRVTCFAERPMTEKALNQKVSVDILNLHQFTYASSVNVHARFVKPNTYDSGPDSSYVAQATNQYICITKVNNSWGASESALENGGKKAFYVNNPDHIYRLELIAEGSFPTRLTATLYDVTAGLVPVVCVSGTDSDSMKQSAGRVALSVSGNGNWDGATNIAIVDNFKYVYPQETLFDTEYKTVFEDDFKRTDSSLGSSWTAGPNCNAVIDSNTLKLNTINRPNVNEGSPRVSGSALMLPTSLKKLNQRVVGEFQSPVATANLGGAVIARCQGATATDDNCYRLEARLGFNQTDGVLTEIYLYNSTELMNTWQIYIDSTSRYQLILETLSISDTETIVTAKMIIVNDDGTFTEKVNQSFTDDDANLQSAGTAGISVYNNYDAAITVYNFEYDEVFPPINPDDFSFNADTSVYKYFEAEAVETFKNKYSKANDENASDMRAAIQDKTAQNVSESDITNILDKNSAFIAYTVYAENAGEYPMMLRYRFGCDSKNDFLKYIYGNNSPYAVVVVNGEDKYRFTNSADFCQFGTSGKETVTLKKGINIIYCMAPVFELASELQGAYIDYDCLFISGDVKVASGDAVWRGDANFDGVVDVNDITRIQKYLNKEDVDIDLVAANLDDSDSVVDSADLQLLEDYLSCAQLAGSEYESLTWLAFNETVYPDKEDMLKNTYYKLKTDKKLNVAFYGGSVSVGQGSTNEDLYSWRGLTSSWLKNQFPDAQINLNNATTGGIGSSFGLQNVTNRLKLNSETDKPDLVFLEFAVNDYYNGEDCFSVKNNMEYILRSIYDAAPTADVVIVLTGELTNMNLDYETKVAHRYIAERYKLPCISVASMLWDDMLLESATDYPAFETYNGGTWHKYFGIASGGYDWVHPNNNGYAKYASYLTAYLGEIFDAKQGVPSGCTDSYIPLRYLSD